MFVRLNTIKNFIILYYFFSSFIFSQSYQKSQPLSFMTNGDFQIRSLTLPNVDVNEQLDQDKRASHLKMLKFGYKHELNHEFLEESNSFIYENKKIFILEYLTSNALGVRAVFEPFFLPEGVSLFVYNHDMSQIAGAYTDENNNEAMYFSTPLVEGEKIIIELNIENYVNLDDMSLIVSSIVHDYRGIIQMRTNNNSNRQCGNDVFCEDAQNFIDQINSVAYIEMSQNICTGTMINNMRNDLTPYFLTAAHCVNGDNPEGLRFYFNYNKNGCGNGDISYGEYAYGSTMISNCDCLVGNYPNITLIGPDFALLQITDSIPTEWEVYYAGINATNPAELPVSSGVHHPYGTYKKINYDNGYATSSDWNSSIPNTHWYLSWDDGGVVGGSSGSALFDTSGNISGILTGGNPNSIDCIDDPGSRNGWYGKISESWQWGDNPENRLKDWLDPENTGELIIDGISNYIPLFIIGDVNNDQTINIQDIILIINFILGSLTPNEDQRIKSDLNLDYLINIQDVLLIINLINN